jgi:hypothetical protein
VKKILSLTLLLVFAAVAQAQQPDYSKVQIKATKVAGNVYMLEGAGGNIGVSVGDDGLLIVDDQFAPLADKIRAALKGIADKKLHFILNTHWHGDHTGGNVSFGPEATIIAHDNVRKRLSTEQKSTVFNRTTPPLQRRGDSRHSLPAGPHGWRQRNLLHVFERGPSWRRLLRWSISFCRSRERRDRRRIGQEHRRDHHEDPRGSKTDPRARPDFDNRRSKELPPHAATNNRDRPPENRRRKNPGADQE